MSNLSVSAPPTSRKDLRHQAQWLRKIAGLSDRRHVPIVELLEGGILDLVTDGFGWDYLERSEMPDEHGLTVIDDKMVYIREDVYLWAADGRGRDRLTIAHEIAHAILHSDVRLARQAPGAEIAAYRNPEWQANCFAGELLIDLRQISTGMRTLDIVREFGVSNDAATTQIRAFIKEGHLRRKDDGRLEKITGSHGSGSRHL